MSKLTGISIGLQICNILGLDPKKTKCIQIDIQPNDVVLVHVVQYLQKEEFNQLSEILKEYKLTPNENA